MSLLNIGLMVLIVTGALVWAFIMFMVVLDVYEWLEKKFWLKICAKCRTRLNRRNRCKPCDYCQEHHNHCGGCQLAHERGMLVENMPLAWETVRTA